MKRMISPFAWRQWQKMQVNARRRNAYEIAHSRLSRLSADTLRDAEAVQAFFVELSDIVRHYLEDRFSLHAPELTTEEFLDVAATSPDLNSEQKSFLRDFLRRADQVKFARHIPDNTTMQEALKYISILSLMQYCQIGRHYWKYYFDLIPVSRGKIFASRLYLNMYWLHKGDKEEIRQFIAVFNEDIRKTTENQDSC